MFRPNFDDSVILMLLLSVACVSTQQLTMREIAFLRDAGLLKPGDIRDAYDGKLDRGKVLSYRAAAKQFLNGVDTYKIGEYVKEKQTSNNQQPVGDKTVNATNITNLPSAVPCPPDVCKHMAICMKSYKDNGPRNFTCLCSDGYFGEFCQYDAIECTTEPCHNNGECRKESTAPRGYKCICDIGFAGETCEEEAPATTEKPSDTVGLSNMTVVGYVIVWCAIVVFFISSILICIDSERKLLFEHYKLYTSLGYSILFPNLDFFKIIIRILYKYVLWCFPRPLEQGHKQQEQQRQLLQSPPPTTMRMSVASTNAAPSCTYSIGLRKIA